MNRWLFLFLFFSSLLSAAPFRFQDRLEKAQNGDYIVTEANKMITVLAIRSHTADRLILEEISAPSQNLKKRPDSWADWVQARAPGHSSWSMMEIDLQSGKLLECYSFSRSSWVQLSTQENLFSTLLQLPLTPTPNDNQKRIGPPPQPGEADHRKIWAPPLIFEGNRIEAVRFDPFETTWPQDETELSGKKISLYFDRENRVPFPFWIQVETSHATAALRTIDSGKNLPTIFRSLPRRSPEFIGMPKRTPAGLHLALKSPPYFREFELYAIDRTSTERKAHPIPYILHSSQGEHLTFEIAFNDLQNHLEADHRYTWLLVSMDHPESYVESPKFFNWPIKN